jgi:hypothetical protein
MLEKFSSVSPPVKVPCFALIRSISDYTVNPVRHVKRAS